MRQADPAPLARASIQRNAPIIAAGAAGAFTIGALAAAGIAPLIVGGLTAATVGPLLTALGGNALASWLATWAERAGNRVFLGDDPDAEQKLIAQLSRDLHAAMATNDALADDIGTLLQRIDAIPVALGALQGQGERQARLLQLLAEDLQSATFRNERLHDVTLQAVLVQGGALRDAYTQGNAQLTAQLDAVLTTVRALRAGDTLHGDKVGGDKVAGSKISIGGNVGTLQNVDINGGTVSGSIIGSQTNYYGAPPTPPAGAATPNQEDIDD
jgi:hypothetical protein